MTRVKICGITTLEDARYCAAAGADYLGFIQYPGSPRFVEPALAREIIEWVYGPETVAVFVNAGADEVNRTADAAGFSIVQLHGDELPALCAEIDRTLIKALRIRPGETADAVRSRLDPYAGIADFFLLDTHHAGQWGGTGRRFDWEIARALAADFPIFLAGGIDAGNVADAVRTVQPYAVDLSSSVEAEPGVKDFDKLSAFFDAFRDIQTPTE
jgi:phosphoribosylanthranilate isomerase